MAETDFCFRHIRSVESSRLLSMDTKIPLHPPPDYATATEKTIAPRNPASPTRIRGNLPLNIPVLNAIRGQRVILASASPRRRQLLAQVGDEYHMTSNTMLN